MKIVVASDIHFGNTSENEATGDVPQPFDKQAHQEFAAEMHGLKPDVLVITGDCAETCIFPDFRKLFFEMYKNPHGDSVAIPGNHDLWLGRPLRTNLEDAFQDFFVQSAANGWFGLKDDPWNKDGIWIGGGMGWYDFSTRDHAFNETSAKDFDEWIFMNTVRGAGPSWADYGMMNMRSALSLNKKRMEEFRACLAKVPPADQRKALVVVSHFPGFERLLTDEFKKPDWGRAFMGNTEIGKLVAEHDANIYVCGHTHRRAEFQLGNTKCINNGSGYGLGSKRYDVFEV